MSGTRGKRARFPSASIATTDTVSADGVASAPCQFRAPLVKGGIVPDRSSEQNAANGRFDSKASDAAKQTNVGSKSLPQKVYLAHARRAALATSISTS